MDRRVSARRCSEYKLEEIINHVGEIYRSSGGPDPGGKKILIKPNILSDHDPSKAISTHPVFVEAVIRFFQSSGAAEIMVGDSPAVHQKGFEPVRSGIKDVCIRSGAAWVSFLGKGREVKLNRGRIKIAKPVLDADLLISLPKLKTHELVYLTAAIKNTLGIVPGFNKAAQHALYSDRKRFGKFLVDLNEAVTPDFFIIDGITAMEGPGPGNGIPVKMNVIIGSCNPLAADIIATKITGYSIDDIPTNNAALERGKWLTSPDDIVYDGPDLDLLVKKDFKRVHIVRDGNMAVKFMIRRIRPLRRFERRPLFKSENCTGCMACINICPAGVLSMKSGYENRVMIKDSKCIRCFCCPEVCPSDAIEVRKKLF